MAPEFRVCRASAVESLAAKRGIRELFARLGLAEAAVARAA
jgi:hypothetical protein